MSKPRALMTRRWPEAAEARAAELFDLTLNDDDTPMSHDALRAVAREYDVIMPTVSDSLPGDFLSGDIRVRMLANYGVGYNHIDVEAAKAAGVVVSNTPGVLTDCTADIAMGLMLDAARRITEGDRAVRAGAWDGWRPTHMIGAKITGATLGIIGFGRIGKAMAKRAHFGFDMDIVFYNRSTVPAEEAAKYGARQLATVNEVMAAADFVSLHCPGGGANAGLIGAEALAAMKPSGILINSARGDVVDEPALIEALQAGRIAGAGLDVFAAEPHVPAALTAMENVVLAPHLGSATLGTREAMGHMALDNAAAFFAGEEPPNRVA